MNRKVKPVEIPVYKPEEAVAAEAERSGSSSGGGGGSSKKIDKTKYEFPVQ